MAENPKEITQKKKKICYTYSLTAGSKATLPKKQMTILSTDTPAINMCAKWSKVTEGQGIQDLVFSSNHNA